jgi:hypothetical protein
VEAAVLDVLSFLAVNDTELRPYDDVGFTVGEARIQFTVEGAAQRVGE